VEVSILGVSVLYSGDRAPSKNKNKNKKKSGNGKTGANSHKGIHFDLLDEFDG
jgi:hypothetical protein